MWSFAAPTSASVVSRSADFSLNACSSSDFLLSNMRCSSRRSECWAESVVNFSCSMRSCATVCSSLTAASTAAEAAVVAAAEAEAEAAAEAEAEAAAEAARLSSTSRSISARVATKTAFSFCRSETLARIAVAFSEPSRCSALTSKRDAFAASSFAVSCLYLELNCARSVDSALLPRTRPSAVEARFAFT